MLLQTLISGSGLIDIGQFPQVDTALLFGVKLLFITAGVIYLLFAALVIRQIAIMSRTVTTTASPVITLVGYLHFVVAVIALLYFCII